MIRRIFKKLVVCAAFTATIFTLGGCSNNDVADSDKTMEGFYQLIIQQDASAITELGIDKKEAKETLTAYQSSMISTLKNNFSSAGVSITDAQAADIFHAVSDKFSKLDYKISVVKEDGKDASVKVSSQYINYLDIFKTAKETTINELKPQHIEKLSDAKKQLVANVVEGFQNAEISKDMKSMTFHLKKQKIKSGSKTIQVFFPEDYEQVGSKLIKLVTNQ